MSALSAFIYGDSTYHKCPYISNAVIATDTMSHQLVPPLTPISNAIVFGSASQCGQHCQFIIGQRPIACNDKVVIASVRASYTLASVCIAGFVYSERARMIKAVHQSAPPVPFLLNAL